MKRMVVIVCVLLLAVGVLTAAPKPGDFFAWFMKVMGGYEQVNKSDTFASTITPDQMACVVWKTGTPSGPSCQQMCSGGGTLPANSCCYVCGSGACRVAYIAACPPTDGGGPTQQCHGRRCIQ